MVRRVLRRLRAPSLPTAISLLALSIVVTGTAFAATGQLVNISDGSNAGNVAKVDSTGALKVGGTVTTSNSTPVPLRPFRAFSFAYDDGPAQLTPATSAALALDRVVISNHGDAAWGRFDETVDLFVRGATSGDCNGNSVRIGSYDLKPNTAIVDGFTVPLRLMPPSGYKEYCVIAIGEVIGDSGSYYAPRVTISGHVISGTYSTAAYRAAGADGPSGDGGGLVVDGAKR
ncbi:MAG TPA: hypothetical protein VF533_01110 [Solirubrobacteraceae bacterium]|jgi:hypothetical protein